MRGWTWQRATVLCSLAGFAVQTSLVQANDEICPFESDQKRVALVIGNPDSGKNTLTAANDAKLLADALLSLGWDVILEETLQLSTIESVLADFEGRIGDADQVLFSYSGHGYQIGSSNYLLPFGGAAGGDDPQFPLDAIFDVLSVAENARKIVILDACRVLVDEGAGNLERTPWVEQEGRPSNTLLFYSAGFATEALDNDGREGEDLSPFARALIDSIREPGLSLPKLVARVDKEVRGYSSQTQNPDDRGVADFVDFYFRPPVEIDLELTSRYDSAFAFLNGSLVASTRADQRLLDDAAQVAEDPGLTLNAGSNTLKLFLANSKTFDADQNWRLPSGWSYDATIGWPHHTKVKLGGPEAPSEVILASTLAGEERYPFKAGPRHGGIFQVGEVAMFVDPKTSCIEATLQDDIWQEGGEQGILWRKSLTELGIERDPRIARLIGPLQAAVILVKTLDLGKTIRLPDLSRIDTVVGGSKRLEPWVRVCMEDRWADRLQALATSIASTLDHSKTKPFESFDRDLSACIRDVAGEMRLAESETLIWTAFDQRHDPNAPGPN